MVISAACESIGRLQWPESKCNESESAQQVACVCVFSMYVCVVKGENRLETLTPRHRELLFYPRC